MQLTSDWPQVRGQFKKKRGGGSEITHQGVSPGGQGESGIRVGATKSLCIRTSEGGGKATLKKGRGNGQTLSRRSLPELKFTTVDCEGQVLTTNWAAPEG